MGTCLMLSTPMAQACIIVGTPGTEAGQWTSVQVVVVISAVALIVVVAEAVVAAAMDAGIASAATIDSVMAPEPSQSRTLIRISFMSRSGWREGGGGWFGIKAPVVRGV